MFQILKISAVPSAGAEVSLKVGLLGREAVEFHTYHPEILQAKFYIRTNYLEYVRSNFDQFIKANIIIHEDANTLSEKRMKSVERLKSWVGYTWKQGVTYTDCLETLSRIYPHMYYLLPPTTHRFYQDLRECADEICRLNAQMILEMKGRIEFNELTNKLTAA